MEISINLGNYENVTDIRNLRDVLLDLEKGDKVTIVLDATDAHEAEEVFRLLSIYGFDYQTKGDHDGKTVYIIANKQR